MGELDAGRGDSSEEGLRRRILDLEASLAAMTAERDRLRRIYALLKKHFELLRRKIFVAKAERIDATQLELEFAETRAKLEAMAKQFDVAEAPPPADEAPPPPDNTKKKSTPTGRRDLSEEDLPETRIELTDPLLEGKAERLRFEESYRYGYRRGGPVRILLARAVYKVTNETSATDGELVTVKKPREIVERGLLAPSLIAHMLVSKYRFGIPFHRLAEMFRAQGVRVDDGTMCRYAEHVGATLGCIVEAMAKEARETAFCLSTDATGVAIQPESIASGRRQACRKGHFFVVLADQDHVFFEYQTAHTSDVICSMFKGFKGYIQADAHAIYNALFRGEALEDRDDKPPDEVGCWAHARRRFWDAAMITKDAPAREALLRIRTLFKIDEECAKLPPKQRHERRQLVSRPVVEDFFAWAEPEFARVKGVRGLTASAFGYAVRQKDALSRFLDDGRLPLTNNHSERALRPLCVGRKNWLFFGSDDHASAPANLFSLVVSCQLHGIDPEIYLAQIIRLVPLWPRDRYLELAPKYWTATRERLDAAELARELGPITVPPPSEEKTTAS